MRKHIAKNGGSNVNQRGEHSKWSGKRILCIGILLCFLCSLFMGESNIEKEKGFSMKEAFVSMIKTKTTNTIFPVCEFLTVNDTEDSFREAIVNAAFHTIPFYEYIRNNNTFVMQVESESTYDMIILCEGNDEYTSPSELSDADIEDSCHVLVDADDTMEHENEEARNNDQEAQEEKEIYKNVGGDFTKAESKQFEYDLTKFQNFNSLFTEFYAIDSSTSVTEKRLNLNMLLSKDVTVKGDNKSPQILIYHTHSQEAFADSIPGDPSTSVVGAGEKLATLLREEYGFNVIHHTGEYDVEKRDYAYAYAAPAVEKILADNPTIEVIIDLHRDAVREDTKLLTNIDGRPTAKFMFFNGLSYNNDLGQINYLPNPNLADNLAFSFKAQVLANEYYPGWTRKIYLRGFRYNMQYLPKSMLIELGAQTNTVEEIMNAIDPLAHIIAMTLSGS